MRKMTGNPLAALALCLALPSLAPSAQVAAVLSGEAGPYKEALEGLKAVVGSVDAATLPATPSMDGVKVVVTFGSEAALGKYPASAALVATLLPDPRMKPKHGGALTRVGLLPEPALLAAKVRALQPGASTLAAFDVGGAYAPFLESLKAAGVVAVSVKKLDNVADLASKLPGLKGAAQALWLPPDPLVMNPKTFGLLASFCQANGIGLYAPVAALAKAGAFAGVAPSFREVGRAAGAAAKTYLEGGKPGDFAYATKVETVVNKAVAEAIKLPGAAAKADSTVP